MASQKKPKKSFQKNQESKVRDRQKQGDPTPDEIYKAVGQSLTNWELLEIELANYFDALVASGNKTAFFAYREILSANSRIQLLTGAIKYIFRSSDKLRLYYLQEMQSIIDFNARINEIAHGIVYNLNEFGFYLGPTVMIPAKWNENEAKYQYTSSDILHYSNWFYLLARKFKHHTRLATNFNKSESSRQ